MAARPDPGTSTDPTHAGARRVAIVMHGFSGGGMERSMLRVAEAFLARGLAVDFVVGQAKGELLQDVPADARIVELAKCPVSRARPGGLAADPRAFALLLRPKSMMGMLKPLVRRLPSLVAHLRQSRPDAILAAEPRYNVIAVWGRQLSGLDSRLVISERIQVSHHARFGGPWGEKGLHDLLRRAYLKADAIVAVSDGVADDLAAHANIPRARISTVYNPVVGPDLAAKAQLRPDHPWFAPGEPPVILAAGRLDPQKDFATLIRAFAELRARRPARLMILGAANPRNLAYAEELRALPATLRIAHDVALPGFVDNPFAFMALASVFVLSSLYEGLPGVLIQAMACGCPVVSTDCPSGPREILADGRFGPLVPVGDVSALAREIENLLDDPPAAEGLRARARLFSLRRAADHYLKLLFPASLSEAASDQVARRLHHLRCVPDYPENSQVASHATRLPF
jgi:glycosyltransferase involved in cell wall biosynthesis